VLPALAAGARLVTLPRGPRMGAAQFTEFLADNAVSVVNLPVGYWSLWTDWLRAAGPDALPRSLRLVVVGSEAVPAATAAWWAETYRDRVRLISAYGLSESTVTNFTYDVTAGGLVAGEDLVPLGSPLPGCRYELLPRPAGADSGDTAENDDVDEDASVSELVLVGDDVQVGYLTLDSDGRRRIGDSGGRHATGDLVRVQDGRLCFLGRSDDLVKVRGVRVSLAEVTTALRSHPLVGDAAVLVRAESAGNRIEAFIALRDSSTEAAEAPADLNSHLAARLAPGAVPTTVTVLPALPHLPSGKLDRRRLEQLRSASQTSDAADDPSRAAEAAQAASGDAGHQSDIQRIMAEILACRIGPHDDFFEHGGHSLLAVQLLNRLGAELGLHISLSDLFAARTPHAVQGATAGGQAMAAADSGLSSLPGLIGGPLPERIPLTAQQEGVWYRTIVEPETRAYHCQSSITLRGPLDADRLEAAFRGIVERNGIYRTSLHTLRGVPHQEMHDTAEFHLGRLEAPDATTSEVERLVADLIAEPFDLTTPPLMRATLLRIAPEHHVLLIVEHHLVHDGYAFALLLRELIRRYEGAEDRADAALAPLDFEYGHYALWQQEFLASTAADAMYERWHGWLGDMEDLALLSPKPGASTGQAVVRRIRVPQAVVDQARRAAARGPATLYGLFRAAVGLALGAQSDQERFCVGMGVANRRLPGADSIMGMFVNIVPSRVQIDRSSLLSEYVQASAAETIRGLEHQELPISHLVRRRGGARGNGNPLYQVLLGFDDGPVPDIRLGAAEGELLERTNGHAKVPLVMTVIPPAEQRVGSGAAGAAHIDVIWEFDSAILSIPDFERLVAGFHHALAVVSAPREAGAEATVKELWESLSDF
jgi:hypothetical protein